jgi:uncharacterized membrane protein YczE
LLLTKPDLPPLQSAETQPEVPAPPERERSLVGRLAQLYFGLSLYGAATALRVRADLGLDPWGAFHQGISQVAGLTFGTTIIVVGAVILLSWIPLRQKPGLGTVSNIVVIGLAADASLSVLPETHFWPMQYVFTFMGTLLTGVAGALYMAAGFGTGPRDGLMVGIVRRTRWPLKRVRGGIELTVLLLGWLLGAVIGIGTLIHALLIGPCLDRSIRVTAALGLGDGAH